MEELIILEYQAKIIANALRLASIAMESSKKETCLDREICKSIEFINNILDKNIILKSNISDLKVSDKIELIESEETFIIDRIFVGGWVDMTATKPFHPELGLGFPQVFFSIKLENFRIINK